MAVHRTEILKCAATITSFDGLLIAARQEQQGESKREIIKIRATSSADDPPEEESILERNENSILGRGMSLNADDGREGKVGKNQ